MIDLIHKIYKGLIIGSLTNKIIGFRNYKGFKGDIGGLLNNIYK